jgi:hypothetical protein
MDPTIIVGGAIATLGLSLWTKWRIEAARGAMWRRVAAVHQLEALEGLERIRRDTFRVGANGVVVRFQTFSRSREERGTTLVLERAFPTMSGSSVAPDAFQKALGIQELGIGDSAFYERYGIEGAPAVACASLDAKARRSLDALATLVPFAVRDGELEATIPGSADVEEKISHVLAALLRVGRLLGRDRDVVEGLADNARSDPERAVRLSCLRFLTGEFPQDPQTRAVLEAACQDEWVDIRLHAALALGEAGHGVLVEIAVSLADDERSADSIAALGLNLPIQRARNLLQNALKKHRPRSAEACVVRIGEEGAVDDEALLLRVLARHEEDEAKVRIAAVRALSRMGTVASVLPLQEEVEQLGDHELQRAAREAIAAIQSRLSGATPGQLSLTVGDAGQVSLADTESGRVSLAPAGPSPRDEAE